ncbi:flagellar hook-length control protein FliK [Xenophilus arseniciresistens]|uniref:Flagellar hook-length control protein FliK n=1 Tax=Xenophilus arseniciresistens TaxID=1283306 RepID=A0AAE3N625_9BURK|nr:flagellar hook-length control protein FliK [Xenophilus arseniciresistens]MDA7415228.1 flagellar hook-length control protein FliK [Xenophilus arseniciresistens]
MSIQPLNPSSQGVERAGLARGSAQEDEAVAGDGAGGAFAGLLAAQDEAPVAADPAPSTERKDEEVADAATDPQAGAQAMGLLLAQSAWTQTRTAARSDAGEAAVLSPTRGRAQGMSDAGLPGTAATEWPGQEAGTSTDTSTNARPGQADATAARETPATEAASAARHGSAAAAWDAALGLPTAALAQAKTAASALRPQALPAAATRAAARETASTSITAAATQRERAQEPGGRWAPRALMPVAAPVEAAALAMNAAAPQLARAQNTEGSPGSVLPGAAVVADAPSSLADPQAGQGAAASPSPEAASFANELADQVSWWLSQKTQGAEMTLDGPGGEPVAVSVQIQGHEAHIAFRSEQAATRQLLSGALGQLEQMLGSSGLALGQVSVGSGMAGREERRSSAAPERVGATAGAGRSESAAPGQPGTPATRAGALRGGVNGAVDLYV